MENMLVRLLPRRRYGVTLRYGATSAIIGLAAFLRYSLEEPLHEFPLLLFFPAVFLCALLFDRGSGFFATLLSAAFADYLFMQPRFSFVLSPQNAFAVFIFIMIGFTMAAVTEALRKTIVRLDQSEQTKGLLFEELAHRTKNDLAIISSAITLQGNASDNPAVRAALKEANSRVFVIAQAQERLRGDRDGGLVDLASYIAALCQGLGDLLRGVRPIAVRVNCSPINVPSSVAVHVGLIVNELVTNSLKYAYPTERGGTIKVDISLTGSAMQVTVADDGVGCPDDFTPGLGSKLIPLLAKQLGGTVERQHAQPGCRVEVTFDEAQLLRQ
ncbi:Histidine kinase-, DNA gyrase B-, and HSP90-like ATPase family protein [Sphingomonas paucimobilis]|nr:Histidine kinase-, DNA gyrase B-, and HSP90-like ATPase family protein [Sphingomonas paucimobilis]